MISNKIVFITGASSGIGKACAEQFAALGCRLIIAARRLERLQQLADQLRQQYQTEVLPIQLNIQNHADVASTIASLPENWQQIDILVNNAGLALASDKIQEGNPSDWDAMIDTNIKGLLYVTRAILPSMVARNSGHIINIGSTAGHDYYLRGNVYCATKHAVKALTRSMRIDLLGTALRVTEIDPGCVDTEFSVVRWQDEARAKQFYADFTPLVAGDVADAVVYCATRKPHVNVSEMIIFPVDQASVSLLNKKGAASQDIFSQKP